MKAIFNTARGTANDTLTIQSVDIPQPGPKEVRVAVRASGINPSDLKLRSGAQGPMVADKVIIHNDGAGVVDAVGDGIGSDRVGERVWLFGANRTEDGLGQGLVGTAAEYVCLPASQTAALPDEVSFEAGACLGVPALTAHRVVHAAGPVDGRTILVTGGAGAVGHSAIQIAKGMGANVIATVSSAEKAAVARDAGADETINYRDEDLVERVQALTGGKGVDHVADVDLAAHIDQYPRIVRSGGSIAAYASATDLTPPMPFYPLAFQNISLHPIFVYSIGAVRTEEAVHDIDRLLSSGQLTPRIARVYDFADIAQAHESLENGMLSGNVVLRL